MYYVYYSCTSSIDYSLCTSDEPTIATTPLQYFLCRQHHLPQLETKLASKAICVLRDEIVSWLQHPLKPRPLISRLFLPLPKQKKNFAHARIGLPLTGNRGWVSLKQSIPGSQCRPCFPDAGFTYCSCRQSARQGLRHPRYLGAENGGTPCLLCHPHSDSHGSKMCETHSAETYAQWVGSSHVMILSYVGRRRSQWCLSWSARSKAVWSHTSVTSHRPCLQYQSTSFYLWLLAASSQSVIVWTRSSLNDTLFVCAYHSLAGSIARIVLSPFDS